MPVGSVTWDAEIAGVYDDAYAALFEPSVLGPMTGLLAELARGGPAVEFAVGTGRVALALSARGITVHGIELSRPMAERLSAKPGAGAVPVIIGDMRTTRVPGTFTLVYLVANTIMNVTTQDDQLAVFANAAAHLEPGGCFVVEVIVPQLRRVPPGETARVFTLDPDHIGIETFDDIAGQIACSHHWIQAHGRLVRHFAPYRYVWPSELDLMAKITGFVLQDGWVGWDRASFTSDSHSQVAVFYDLEPVTAQLWDLVHAGYKANWFCHIASHAAELDRQTLQRLVALLGDLWLDVCGETGHDGLAERTHIGQV